MIWYFNLNIVLDLDSSWQLLEDFKLDRNLET